MAFANDCLDLARVPVNALSVLTTSQCACDEVRLQLKDIRTGAPFDLTALGLGPSSSSSSSESLPDCGIDLPEWCACRDCDKSGVEVVTKAVANDNRMPIRKYAVIKSTEDAAQGIVYLELTPSDTQFAGVWSAMAIVRQCGVTRKVFPFYLEIMPSLDQINAGSGPLTIYEVRISLRDTDPKLNHLIDAYDFQDHEIAFMIRKALDIWNETPPHTVAFYTINNFPFRHHWIEVTAGQLMIMAADWLRRNDLDYSAAGLTVQDTAKWPYYSKEGQRRITEFKAWAVQTKLTLNIEGGFSTLGGWRNIVQR